MRGNLRECFWEKLNTLIKWRNSFQSMSGHCDKNIAPRNWFPFACGWSDSAEDSWTKKGKEPESLWWQWAAKSISPGTVLYFDFLLCEIINSLLIKSTEPKFLVESILNDTKGILKALSCFLPPTPNLKTILLKQIKLLRIKNEHKFKIFTPEADTKALWKTKSGMSSTLFICQIEIGQNKSCVLTPTNELKPELILWVSF